MVINPIVAAALGGAAGGALGALVGFLAQRITPVSWHRIVVVVCAAAFAVAGGRLGATYGEQQAETPVGVEAQLFTDPDMAALALAWKRADPTSYQAFVARIGAGLARREDRTAIINETRTTVMTQAKERLPRVDDAHVAELIDVTADELRALQTAKPEICVAMMRGEPFGDVAPFIGPVLARREMALLTAAFAADPNGAPAAMQQPQVEAELTAIVNNLRIKFGDEVSLLSPQATVTGKEARVCEIGAAFYDSMAQLPNGAGPRLMRNLMLTR